MDDTEFKTSCKKLLEESARAGELPVSRQDAGIQAEVWLAFWQADDLKALDVSCIDIVVHQCEVWLQGEVDDSSQLQLAESLVKAISGVCGCHNELQVKSRDG